MLTSRFVPHVQETDLVQVVGSFGLHVIQGGIRSQAVDHIGDHPPDRLVNPTARLQESVVIQKHHDMGHGLQFIHRVGRSQAETDRRASVSICALFLAGRSTIV